MRDENKDGKYELYNTEEKSSLTTTAKGIVFPHFGSGDSPGDDQLWRLEEAHNGGHYIVNEKHGCALVYNGTLSCTKYLKLKEQVWDLMAEKPKVPEKIEEKKGSPKKEESKKVPPKIEEKKEPLPPPSVNLK